MSINKKIKERSYEIVRQYEEKNGRKVESENYEKDGYDLKSISLTEPREIRHIEVKGTKSNKISWRWLEQKQFDNIKNDPCFYLYFVKNINTQKPEVLELSGAQLQKLEPKKVEHYVYSKKQIEQDGTWQAV